MSNTIQEEHLQDYHSTSGVPVELKVTVPQSGESHFLTSGKVKGLAAIALCGLAFVGVEGVLNKFDSLGSFLDGAVPHPEVNVQAMDVLNSVSITDKTILIEGSGKATANLAKENVSKAPLLIGRIFNATIGKWTIERASTVRNDTLAIGANPGTIHFTTYNNGNSTGGLEAVVNPNGLFSQVNPPDPLNAKASQLTPAIGDPPLQRIIDVFTGDGHVGDRTLAITNYADTKFQDVCGVELNKDIPAGIPGILKTEVSDIAGVLASTQDKEKKDMSKYLFSLLQKPVRVLFKYPVTNSSGENVGTTLSPDPSRIVIPSQQIPSEAILAKQLGVHYPDRLHVDSTGSCMYDGLAIRQEEQIIATSNSIIANGVTTAKVGINNG